MIPHCIVSLLAAQVAGESVGAAGAVVAVTHSMLGRITLRCAVPGQILRPVTLLRRAPTAVNHILLILIRNSSQGVIVKRLQRPDVAPIGLVFPGQATLPIGRLIVGASDSNLTV